MVRARLMLRRWHIVRSSPSRNATECHFLWHDDQGLGEEADNLIARRKTRTARFAMMTGKASRTSHAIHQEKSSCRSGLIEAPAGSMNSALSQAVNHRAPEDFCVDL
jgi:hypothetical protein